MSSNVLSSFFAGAVGESISSSIEGIELHDLEWAKGIWSQREQFLKSADVAASFEKPNVNRIIALKALIQSEFEKAYDELASTRLVELKEQKGAFVVNKEFRFYRSVRIIHLNPSSLLPEVLNPAWGSGVKKRNKDSEIISDISELAFIRSGAKSGTSLMSLLERALDEDLRGLKAVASEKVLGQSVDDFKECYGVLPAGFPMEMQEVFDAMIDRVEASMFYSGLTLTICLAHRLGRALYPVPLKSDAAGSLLLDLHQQIRKESGEKEFKLTPHEMKAALEMWNESPSAFKLYLAVAPCMADTKESLPHFQPTTIQAFKQSLQHEFGLTQAGWKKLLSLSESSEWGLIRSLQLYAMKVKVNKNGYLKGGTKKPSRFILYRCAAHHNDYYSQSAIRITTPVVGLISSLVMAANMSAEYQLSLSKILSVMRIDGSGFSDTRREVSGWMYIQYYQAPRSWREWNDRLSGGSYIDGHEEMTKELRLTLGDLWQRYGVLSKKKMMLSAVDCESMIKKGWSPMKENDHEYFLYQLYQDYKKGETHSQHAFKVIIQEIVSRPSMRLKEQIHQISDMFFDADARIWVNAPEKITFSWLKKASDLWHEESIKKAADDAVWKPLIEAKEYECGEGFVAKELISGAELAAEGRRMKHCVGRYAKKCARGESRIFSIQTKDNSSSSSSSSSTIEVTKKRSRSLYSIQQHHIVRNKKPSLEHLNAGKHLLLQINELEKTMIKPSVFWSKFLFWR